MRLTIDKIPASALSLRDFYALYYENEKPVVLSGLQAPFEAGILDKIWSMAEAKTARQRNGHIAYPWRLENAPMRAPQLVKSVFAKTDIVHKPEPLKLWMHPKGHQTLLHYDGNSLHGLNWQVAGRKNWLLLSPDTHPRMMPFTWVAMTKGDFEPNPDIHDFYDFETQAGDMLFLPRYWSHRVTSMETCNANLNWVWTPRQPNLRVAAGRRECAVLKLQAMMGRLNRLIWYKVSHQNYADGGPEIFDNYTSGIGLIPLIIQCARELGNLLLLPFFRRSVRQQMYELREHNFPQSLKPF